jgi:hypothetical protein
MSMDRASSRPKPPEAGPKARLYEALSIDNDRTPGSGAAPIFSLAARLAPSAQPLEGARRRRIIGEPSVSEQDQETEGFSMIVRRARGDGLITAAIAVEIARMVLRNEHGQSELDRDEPFSVVADGDVWIVRGRDPPPAAVAETPAGFPPAGPFQMRISRFNGQIFECCFVMALPDVSARFRGEDEG